MIHLDLGKRSREWITPTGDERRYRISFNYREEQFVAVHMTNWHFQKPMYEWMLEHIGWEVFAVREWDRIFYGDADKFIRDNWIPRKTDFDEVNPLVPKANRTWLIKNDKLYFTETQYATLFKLHWF